MIDPRTKKTERQKKPGTRDGKLARFGHAACGSNKCSPPIIALDSISLTAYKIMHCGIPIREKLRNPPLLGTINIPGFISFHDSQC